jgi:hypothetical protein
MNIKNKQQGGKKKHGFISTRSFHTMTLVMTQTLSNIIPIFCALTEFVIKNSMSQKYSYNWSASSSQPRILSHSSPQLITSAAGDIIY